MKKETSSEKCQFTSDNYSGICPEAVDAILEANTGFAKAYGEDRWTQRAADKIRKLFDTDCEVFFVFNGTAANSLALSSLCQSYHSVICHDLSHVETDECGAPEFFSNGMKILTVPGENGKIDLSSVENTVIRRSDIHYPKPRVLSITQPTEAGTVYSINELMEIDKLTKRYSLRLHMDGARFANAIASLNVHPGDITWKAGVDVLCMGGTKNGIAFGEAVIFFNRELAFEFDYRCKQAGQLASKMRFLSAPWIKMLESGAWLKYAKSANESALLLYDKLIKLKAIEIAYPCQANSVFVKMNQKIADGLKNRGWHFYNFIGTGFNRFMCSWDTSREDVENLINDLEEVIETQ